VRPPRKTAPIYDPPEPQVAVVERPPIPEGSLKWPPGLLVDLEWAALWAVD